MAKKKKMSKEEKQALKKKEKEEFELKVKKDKLDRELDFTKSQVSEIRRKVFEQAKLINLPIIKEEWLHKWGYFERTNDWKDFYISQLRDDIFYSESHHQLMEQKHNENMDQLIDIYNEAISKLMNSYKFEREKLLKDRMSQETRLVLTQNRKVENMETIMFILMKQRKQEMEKLNWENSNQKQLKIFRYEEAIARVAQEGDEEMRDLWSSLKTIFDRYKSATAKKRQDYLIMKQKDIAEKENLIKLSRRMTQLHKTIKQCRGKLNKLKIDEAITLELETRKSAYERLKKDMKDELEFGLAQLETLSVTSNNLIKKLSDFCQKVTEAVTLLSICRKLETEEEKVSPKLNVYPPLALFRNNQILPMFDDVEQLWAKIMHVTTMKEYMATQLQQLKDENMQLNKKLRSALSFKIINCEN